MSKKYFGLLVLLTFVTGLECLELAGCDVVTCSHKCTERLEIAKCSCPEDMVLGPDKKTCSAAAPLLVGMFRGISLYSESSGEFQRLVSGQLTAFDYHYKNKELYAFSKTNNTLFKYSIARTDKKPTPTAVIMTDTMLTSLVVDWVNDQLYWICEQKSAVESASLTGTNHNTITKFNETGDKHADWSNLVVDPYVKKLFWLGKGVIYSLSLDDKKPSQVQLEPSTGSLTPEDISLDTHNQLLYVIGSQGSRGDKVVVKAKYDGSRASQVISLGQSGSEIFGFCVWGQRLYWQSNHDGENLYKSEIPEAGQPTTVTLVEELYQIVFDVKVFHADLQRPMK